MRTFWPAVALAPLVLAAAADGAQAAPTDQGPMIGIAMICNTSDQAEQFIGLRVKGIEAKQALQAVNTDAKDPSACGVAAVAFVRDATLDSQAVKNKLLQVVRISIVAGFNGTDWRRVEGTVQYAVLEAEGETI